MRSQGHEQYCAVGSSGTLIDPHREGDGTIPFEFGKAEVMVEAPGAVVVGIDTEMHRSDAVISQRLKLNADHPASPTGCLKSGKDVDVKMRGVVVLKPRRAAARVLNTFDHVGVARTGGRQASDLLADERPPIRLQLSVERPGIRDADDIADRAAVLNQHKGKVFGEFEIGHRPDVAGQMRVAIERAGIVAAVRGFQADVEKGFGIRFGRRADGAVVVHHFATSCVAFFYFRLRGRLMH